MVGYYEDIDGVVSGFRLYDTDKKEIVYIGYKELHRELKSRRIEVQNLCIKVEAVDSGIDYVYKNMLALKSIGGDIIDECSDKLIMYPKMMEEETYIKMYRSLILIGTTSYGEYVCVNVYGELHILSRDDINYDYGFNILNECEDLGVIDVSGYDDTELNKQVQSYKSKCNLLGIGVSLIKRIGENITLVAGGWKAETIIVPDFVTHIGILPSMGVIS